MESFYTTNPIRNKKLTVKLTDYYHLGICHLTLGQQTPSFSFGLLVFELFGISRLNFPHLQVETNFEGKPLNEDQLKKSIRK